MPTIHFVLKDGNTRSVDAPVGQSVMEAAILNNVRGIDAECGGCASCATCHVYVAPAYFAQLPEPDDMERELLEGVAAERRPTSRLSCQIALVAELDGLVIHIPATQA